MTVIELPDDQAAILKAKAAPQGLTLVTRNIKDFSSLRSLSSTPGLLFRYCSLLRR